MALSRKFLAALGIEGDKVDEIINAHTETVDALKNERDSFKADAEKLKAVQQELDEMKAAKDKDGKDPYRVKYEAVKADFDKYKADIAAKESKAKKTASYRDLLKQAGVRDSLHDRILSITDVDGIDYGEDGKVKDADKLLESIKSEWADFIIGDDKDGGKKKVDFGGSLGGGKKTMTKDEIMDIKDDAKRQAAILDNHELFGF